MKMFGECHAHIFLNGYDYRKAVETQKNGPRDALIRAHLEEYRKRGIRFVRRRRSLRCVKTGCQTGPGI